MLIVMTGLPATGKSAIADALARAIPAPVFSVDPIEAALWRQGIGRDRLSDRAAYDVATALAEAQLRIGLPAIIDSVAGYEFVREGWRALARQHRAPMRVIECVCSDQELHRRRLAQRIRGVPDEMEPTWEEVRAREYEPWSEERLVLDSVDPLTKNVERALAFIGK